jgi:hypothetical protein
MSYEYTRRVFIYSLCTSNLFVFLLYLCSKLKVIAMLRRVGLMQTAFEDDVLIEETFFCVDKDHPDLIRFHSTQADSVRNLPISRDGKLVIQVRFAYCMFISQLYASMKS